MSSQGAGEVGKLFSPHAVFAWRADAETLRRVRPAIERLVTIADRERCETADTLTCEEMQVWPRCLACEIKDIRRELYSAVWARDEVTGEKDELGTS